MRKLRNSGEKRGTAGKTGLKNKNRGEVAVFKSSKKKAGRSNKVGGRQGKTGLNERKKCQPLEKNG